ncbi:lipopolysaccharide assembly LapA domain-containing protein [Paenibacillus sp. L3-i20]|uniref:LapA family protein n=1 Tax=Paenibacillus sp. L3-i20 TaxID=2905833 RepID=UPI001EDDDE78|nr:lipopolysaccharide assembly protein LapA domain-containing protein [Paenibacillus sp. L3-i20]GKU76263.1 hypothetical protein L3i20_v206600 [Paenibacillus sp. L3-i20]
MKGQGMLISAFVFALVIAIFAVINVESVQVNFLFAKTTTPLILVILVSTLLGGLTVGLFGMIRIYKLQKTVKTLEKQVADGSIEAEAFEASYSEINANRNYAEIPSEEVSNELIEDTKKDG